ncbi:MAG: ATP-binding protein, partial [Porticoccaceae bacterium]
WVRLAPLLRPIIDNAIALSGDKHAISLDCSDDMQVRGDPRELHSAFSNLIYNAVKHNPQGCAITVSVAATEQTLSVTVADNGVGIDPKHLPRLTERFYRVDDSRATSSGGTGLGLAIVKHVLLRHRGQLDIHSTLGKGTTFICQFQLA